MDNYFTHFGSVYGGGSYVTTTSGTSGSVSAVIAVAAFVGLVCLIVFISLIVHFWRRKATLGAQADIQQPETKRED